MGNLVAEYRDRIAKMERDDQELLRLAKAARPLPEGVREVGEGLFPPRLMEALRQSSSRSQWPWYFHGDGRAELAYLVYRGWQGSAVWFPFEDICEGRRRNLWRSVGLLVVNEVATITMAGQLLCDLIRERQKRPTIVTGSLSQGELSVFGDDFRSWIAEGNVINFSWLDSRSRKCERGTPRGDLIDE